MPLPEARAGRSVQAEGSCGGRQLILRPILGVRRRPARTVRLSQRPRVRRQKPRSDGGLRLSVEGCVLRRKANCQWDNVPFNPLNYSNHALAPPDGPISNEHCDWLYGIFGHETSCTRYWTCWNGTATEQLCIGGLLYNEQAHSCDWPEVSGDSSSN